MLATKKRIRLRPITNNAQKLAGFDVVLQRIFNARGIHDLVELEQSLSLLPSPWLLANMELMVQRLISAIQQAKKIVVVADFDADGATSCAVAIQGLSLLGARKLAFIVPNRFEHEYGLTPEIVLQVQQQYPDVAVIITVDNGISSFAGVEQAHKLGIEVLITDHHVPADTLPIATAIVNPQLSNDNFPSKNLAGVGVIFYVLMALRIRLREQGFFAQHPEPNLAQLLDYVALGTVADVVKLDQVNRILVHQGLLRLQAGKGHVGLIALAMEAKKNCANLSSTDLGFGLAPRLNAAGRMQDMSIGIQCLLSTDLASAQILAQQLESLNAKRKEVEMQMKQQAFLILEAMHNLQKFNPATGICLFDADWHQGVIGILAARIKDKLHCPVIVFAAMNAQEIKGSARSIAGVHMRDVLAEIARQHPHILTKFGGHAMAAGLTIQRHHYPAFKLAFTEVITTALEHLDLNQVLLSDGELTNTHLTLGFAETLQTVATWGHGFPEPKFHGEFEVLHCRIIANKHLKFSLRVDVNTPEIEAIAFFVETPENYLGMRRVKIAYKLTVNTYLETKKLQLIIEYFEKLQ